MLTPSAVEYLKSIPFAEKRVNELHNYIEDLYLQTRLGKMLTGRFQELENSAWGLLMWWQTHLKKLKDEQEKRTAGTLGHG